MKFRIYGIDKNGYEDSIIIQGESIEEIRAGADQEKDLRGWVDCWSEVISDE